MPPIPVMLMVRQTGAGGTERQFVEALKGLDRKRFSPHAACFVEGFRSEELRAAGIPIVRIPVTSFARPSVLANVGLLGRYLKEHGIRLVHTFDHPANIFGAIAARWHGTPVVLSSSRSLRSLRTPRDRRLLRLTDRLVDAVVANCDAVRRDLIEQERVPAAKIRVWHNGVDARRLAGPRSKPEELHGAGIVIGVVALLRPEKGIDTLVEAFARIAQAHPEAALVIVGSGAMEQVLKDQAGRLGVARRCRFIPTAADVGPWLRAIDIFVLPSRSEALSNSIMEAMACGCAVIASRVGGNPELVLEGETGLLFPVDDAAALAERLTMLIRDEALRKRLAGGGCERIRNEFGWENSIAQLEAIYQEFLTPAGGLK